MDEKERTCIVCGEKFISQGPGYRICSSACKYKSIEEDRESYKYLRHRGKGR